MGRSFFMPTRAPIWIGCLLLFFTPSLRAAINIEWRPLSHVAQPGEVVDIHLFVVSDSEFLQSIGAMIVVFTWDALRLKFLGHVDPCTAEPCAEGTYVWLQSWFPNDENLDGMNDDCGDGIFCESISCSLGCPPGVECNKQTGFCISTGLPVNDGDARYEVLSQLGGGEKSAQAIPEGLWVTTLRFEALSTGFSEVRILPEFGTFSRTLIIHGDSTGVEVTGTIGPPAQVLIGGCGAPDVESVGSRYLAITPGFTDAPIGLIVTGDPGDAAVDCISLFVQQDGTLDEEPFFQSPELWGTIHVGDRFIQPENLYHVQMDCRMLSPGLVSDSISALTFLWGDINHDGVIRFDDLLLVIDGVQGDFDEGVIPESMDIMPCTPDGVIDDLDLDAVKNAMNSIPFPCRESCAALPPLSDWPLFMPCLQGPDVAPSGECFLFDIDLDDDVDLKDVSEFIIRPPDF